MLPKPDILQMVEDGGADGEFFWARRWGVEGGVVERVGAWVNFSLISLTT